MNTARVLAIFEKDLKDFMKNTMVLFMPFLPIILAIVYSRMGGMTEEEMPLFVIYMVVGITFSAVTANLIMIMMAEENEKGTLRGLIMSPASFIDIIIGKSLVATMMTLITLILSLIILGVTQFFTPFMIVNMLLLFLFFLLVGIGIGLFVKSVGMTTVYMMPLMFLFGFTPMALFLGFEDDHIVMKILDYFPMMMAIDYHDSGAWVALLTMLAWVIVAAVFTFICFIKTSKDR